MPGFMKGRRSLTMGCLMIMEIWAIYPLLELPYLAWISHFSAPLIYSSRRLEEPKENWLHNSIWKTLQQPVRNPLNSEMKIVKKDLHLRSREIRDKREEREKKGFWSLRLMEIWAMYPLLFGLNFTLLHTTGSQEKKNEITQKKRV